MSLHSSVTSEQTYCQRKCVAILDAAADEFRATAYELVLREHYFIDGSYIEKASNATTIDSYRYS